VRQLTQVEIISGIGLHVAQRIGILFACRQRQLKSGGGFVSFDEPVLHFGLGDHSRVERIEVRWSDGEVSEIGRPLAGGNR